MKKFLRGTAAAGLLAALAVAAAAQQTTPAPPRGDEGRDGRHAGPRRGGKRFAHGHGLRALGRLNLSDEQRAQLRVLHENLRRSTETPRAELRQLFAGRAAGGPLTDEQRARAGQLRDELRRAGESHRQQVLGLLTPEQRAQLEEWKQEREQRRDERRQRREERRQRRQSQGETL